MAWTITKTLFYILLSAMIILTLISSLNLTYRAYKGKVSDAISRNQVEKIEILQTSDLEELPTAIRNYLNYVGVVGHEKVHSYKLDITGEFKMDEDKNFSPVQIRQSSFQDDFTRLFYMKMHMKGIKIAGLHHLVNKKAVMEIKLLDVFKIVDERGEAMNQAELVTVFNDMAIMAPATLIDDRITWEEIDDYQVIGILTNGDDTISAKLFFNELGQLINFISEDRYATINGKSEKVRWETPITEYHKVNGLNLPYKGTAKWVYEDRTFTYIKMQLNTVTYNEGLVT